VAPDVCSPRFTHRSLLVGDGAGVGDWRIIADIDDGVVTIIVLPIGNRREVYRR
jgi:hypothetical protein